MATMTTRWVKGDCEATACVEVRAASEWCCDDKPVGVFLKATYNAAVPLFITADEWRVFVAGIKRGDFDWVLPDPD